MSLSAGRWKQNDFNDLERESRGLVIKRPCIIGARAQKHKSLSHNISCPIAEAQSHNSAHQSGKGQHSKPRCSYGWNALDGRRRENAHKPVRITPQTGFESEAQAPHRCSLEGTETCNHFTPFTCLTPDNLSMMDIVLHSDVNIYGDIVLLLEKSIEKLFIDQKYTSHSILSSYCPTVMKK